MNTWNKWLIEAPFLDLNVSISNDISSIRCYNKRNDFYFDIVIFQIYFYFFKFDIPRATFYGVYTSHLIKSMTAVIEIKF